MSRMILIPLVTCTLCVLMYQILTSFTKQFHVFLSLSCRDDYMPGYVAMSVPSRRPLIYINARLLDMTSTGAARSRSTNSVDSGNTSRTGRTYSATSTETAPAPSTVTSSARPSINRVQPQPTPNRTRPSQIRCVVHSPTVESCLRRVAISQLTLLKQC
ncbi:hypothetical protein DFJ58DRAFT_249503 [Suillus subalutaceus]|uniref:uncharacterized protein n=1 Tax=Suillus subalutaceus TaxID=48586 RepID=UPI001B860882|nr:uncharacterized protein DFJ58DRAFT_249503 [Suillus subalutaceus]KAG1831433.1 hypothetical protein DFJ58DRAFT_249503 [Suillus subalutaceus]